jgi:hypothetical protein
MNAARLIADALTALQPRDGFHQPNGQQLAEADIRARLATAAALDHLGDALERLAGTDEMAGIRIRSAIHHNA